MNREQLLAQLGARVLEILNDPGPGFPSYLRYDHVEEAARSLGLLPEVKP